MNMRYPELYKRELVHGVDFDMGFHIEIVEENGVMTPVIHLEHVPHVPRIAGQLQIEQVDQTPDPSQPSPLHNP